MSMMQRSGYRYFSDLAMTTRHGYDKRRRVVLGSNPTPSANNCNTLHRFPAIIRFYKPLYNPMETGVMGCCHQHE